MIRGGSQSPSTSVSRVETSYGFHIAMIVSYIHLATEHFRFSVSVSFNVVINILSVLFFSPKNAE